MDDAGAEAAQKRGAEAAERPAKPPQLVLPSPRVPRRPSFVEQLVLPPRGGARAAADAQPLTAAHKLLAAVVLGIVGALLFAGQQQNNSLAAQLAALRAQLEQAHAGVPSAAPNASLSLSFCASPPVAPPAADAAADADDSGASAGARAVAALLSFVVSAAPYAGVTYLRSVPFGTAGSGARHTLAHAASYRLDQFFSTNAASKPLALLVLTALLVIAGSSALFAVSGQSCSSVVWAALAGVGLDWTFAGEEGTSAMHRATALLLAVGGMLVTALMLGVVSDAIGEKMDDLRKGRSDVLEEGHTLILGWSDKLLPILRQLALANASEGGGCVVILAERDKEAMDADVAEFLSAQDAAGTVVVCRTGSPLLTSDLARVSAATARAIIVLADGGGGGAAAADGADATTLRVVLSLSHLRDHGGGLAGHMVAEVCDLDNEPLMALVGGPSLMSLVSHDVIGRIMLQCAAQPGLSFVFEDLLGFEGAEFYHKVWPQLAGTRFGDVPFLFPEAVPCGVVSAEGAVWLNPHDDYLLREDDALLVIAEDDDSYAPTEAAAALGAAASAPPPARDANARPQRVLFVGWRRDLQDLVLALDEFSQPGSELWIMCELPEAERVARFAADGLDVLTGLKTLTLRHAVGDTVSRKDLSALPLETFDSVLILAAGGTPDATSSAMDSHTLATLLLIRDIQAKRHAPSQAPASSAAGLTSWVDGMRGHAARHCAVIAEILDTRTRQLVAATGICDYVLSNELISNALAMLAEDPSIHAVLRELFNAAGQELRVVPGAAYVAADEGALSFWDVASRARQRHEVLLGAYCAAAAEDGGAAPRAAPRRAVLNPSNKAAPRQWGADDFLVVMAGSQQAPRS